jgi:hypothetical protein
MQHPMQHPMQGAFAIYMEPWHADVFEFLDMRKNTGKVGGRKLGSRWSEAGRKVVGRWSEAGRKVVKKVVRSWSAGGQEGGQ